MDQKQIEEIHVACMALTGQDALQPVAPSNAGKAAVRRADGDRKLRADEVPAEAKPDYAENPHVRTC